MSWLGGLVLYVVIWWVVLFTVLPWGVRVPDNPEPGFAPSAPEKPRMWLKAAVTTGIAGAIWAIVYWVAASGLIDLRAPYSP